MKKRKMRSVNKYWRVKIGIEFMKRNCQNRENKTFVVGKDNVSDSKEMKNKDGVINW